MEFINITSITNINDIDLNIHAKLLSTNGLFFNFIKDLILDNIGVAKMIAKITIYPDSFI